MDGFSLIEMIVSVGILVFIVSIVLANHSRFNSSVLLGALAYDVALSVREAQVYGISVKEFAGSFDLGYGIRFERGSNSFILFADVDRSKSYNPTTGDDKVLNTYTLRQGHSIVRFCGKAGVTERCSDSATPINHLDIAFVRPNPDAWITSNESATGSFYSEGFVVVSSPAAGATRTIDIASTGQISVKNP